MAGCSEYLSHRDTITAGAGNAQAANRAIQTVNPWPVEAASTVIASDGRIVKRTMDVYAAPPGSGGTSGAAASSAPPPAATPAVKQ
jgi:hypothetical protein